jgi:hypothetical protein
MNYRQGPYSFSVFIARRSGARAPRERGVSRKEKALFTSDMAQLAETKEVIGDPELEGAQLALRRCLHLSSEMARIVDVAPDAAAITGRSVVEHALIGSYLALYRAAGGGAAGLMKKQRGHASGLRDYFLKGDMLGALSLLPEISFVSAPLSPTLDAVTGMPNFHQICFLLDEKEPFVRGKLATMLYYETCAPLSNLLIHPTPHSLERHRQSHLVIRRRNPNFFGPSTAFSDNTLQYAILPAMGGLCSCLARALRMPTDYYDMWLREAGSVDGYEWSGSIARTVAVGGLVELVGLPNVHALNAAGLATRMLATADIMMNANSDDQLLAASEIIDRARAKTRWPAHPGLRLIASMALIRPRSSQSIDNTKAIATGHAAGHPQALLAALALVYAGLWPDEPSIVSARLDAFDREAPHESTALETMLSRISPKDARSMRKKWKNQVAMMK